MGAKTVESWNVKGEIVEDLIKSALKVGRNYNFYVAFWTLVVKVSPIVLRIYKDTPGGLDFKVRG